MSALGIRWAATASQRAWKLEPLPLAITKMRHLSVMMQLEESSGVSQIEGENEGVCLFAWVKSEWMLFMLFNATLITN